jgi:hypothetical protein
MDDLELTLPVRRRVFVRLDELPDPDGHPAGKRVRLLDPSLIVLRLAGEYDKLTPEQRAMEPDRLWDIAAHLLPDLTRAEVNRLSYGTIQRILALGQQPIAELEVLAKNGGAPGVEAPKGTASNSPTPPPTRSRGSRSRRTKT